ncbi:MAG: HI1506-related protein [Burkholderiaceae bacterium]
MATKKLTAAGPADKGLRVVARPQGGFRRAGFHFSAEGITLPLSELTADQVEQLRAEPQLVVVDEDIAPA